ncbi:23S rRNA (adenine(2030)-N(6))-methyltransferase RlmJ [Halomonas almeriensis]|uniref:23S rRNA (adenine(2030)-N(6))-methyltransferase RlmJ n=1 Tax=Halomonas almeriensis TaxID=308163 RepID=UPI0025B49AA6|nr:23S rRNA (adenine(2030)-N(6))-methyltransferase RlmJ [Halomonas almeriensis]MDN3552500.1 23S rRNA (adenine(2030)-N(6))-methyltransferase RlmJ [Halomonas almeriensis]
MLSYQHAYHAGNFADVHKHLTLYAVVDHLLRKDSSVTYIDTHAGRGRYSLAATETSRLAEYRNGVARLWEARTSLQSNPLLSDWLAAVQAAQQEPSSGRLDHYPGSPWWLAQRLRKQDDLQLFELHPGEHSHLSQQELPARARHRHADGLSGLLTALPVKSPRLCVLVDPSYERKSEYSEVAATLLKAMRKTRHAVVLVWYPLLPAGHHATLLEALKEGGQRKIWRSELSLTAPAQERGMYGSGMLVINPPWGLEQRLAAAMDRLTPLWGDAGQYLADWWVSE